MVDSNVCFSVSCQCLLHWALGRRKSAGWQGRPWGGARGSALCCVWWEPLSHPSSSLALTSISISAIFHALKEFPKGHCSKIRRNRCFQRKGPPLTGCNAQVEGVDAVDYKQNAATVHSQGCHPAIGGCAQADAFSRGRWVMGAAGWWWCRCGPRLLCPGEGVLWGKQPASDNAAAAWTKNRILCLIWISHLKQEQNSSESRTICFPLRLGHK